jgi:hypothetical protein
LLLLIIIIIIITHFYPSNAIIKNHATLTLTDENGWIFFLVVMIIAFLYFLLGLGFGQSGPQMLGGGLICRVGMWDFNRDCRLPSAALPFQFLDPFKGF